MQKPSFMKTERVDSIVARMEEQQEVTGKKNFFLQEQFTNKIIFPVYSLTGVTCMTPKVL